MHYRLHVLHNSKYMWKFSINKYILMMEECLYEIFFMNAQSQTIRYYYISYFWKALTWFASINPLDHDFMICPPYIYIGSALFSTGDINWICSSQYACFDKHTRRTRGNLSRRIKMVLIAALKEFNWQTQNVLILVKYCKIWDHWNRPLVKYAQKRSIAH